MRYHKTTEQPGSGTLTRRQMVKVLASVGAAASPLMSPLAAAAEIGNRASMVAAIFFESYATVAFRRALRYAARIAAAKSVRRHQVEPARQRRRLGRG